MHDGGSSRAPTPGRFVAAMSRCAALSLDAASGREPEVCAHKVRGGGGIDFVAGALGIRHREVCSAGRRQTHGHEARR